MDDAELRTQLVQLHNESYGWALSCCSRDPRQAEEVLQTVYLKILESKARFEGKATFKTWLFSVIRKTAADERRKNIFRRFRFINYEERDEPISQEGDSNERMYESEIRMLFQQALATLPRRQREVLHLVFYHDFSIADAAEAMWISIGSARTHYERGKQRLRQLIKESKIFDEPRLERKENQRII